MAFGEDAMVLGGPLLGPRFATDVALTEELSGKLAALQKLLALWRREG